MAPLNSQPDPRRTAPGRPPPPPIPEQAEPPAKPDGPEQAEQAFTPPGEAPEPVVEKWPGKARLLFITGAGLVGWGAVYLLVRLALHLFG